MHHQSCWLKDQVQQSLFGSSKNTPGHTTDGNRAFTLDTLKKMFLAQKARRLDSRSPNQGRLLAQSSAYRPNSSSNQILAIYAVALAAAIVVWLFAIRAPLWLDETISYWEIKGGFSQILPRQGLATAPYSYILWFGTRILGTSEVALRIPSVLAMLAATYLLYRAAREMFDSDVSLFASVIFCLNPIITFEAIDARPYAFGALAINSAILVLLCTRRGNSIWLVALLGVATASILYFHLLFAPILPVILGFFIWSRVSRTEIDWRSIGICALSFAVACLPEVPSIFRMFRTGGMHVFEQPPAFSDLFFTLVFPSLFLVLLPAIFAAILVRRFDWRSRINGWNFSLCLALAVVPALSLYVVSVASPLHLFVERHRLVAVPGIALSWGWILSRITSRGYRVLFCLGLTSFWLYARITSPSAGEHGYTWKHALEFAQKDAVVDSAPVLICSDLPEADYMELPVGLSVKDSALFAPLTYYELTVPVVALPRSLNSEAMRVGSEFIEDASRKKKRFLALAFIPSYKTLDWLAQKASGNYDVRVAAQPDGIRILEFLPRIRIDSSR